MSLPPLDMHCHPIQTGEYLSTHPYAAREFLADSRKPAAVTFAVTMSPEEWRRRGDVTLGVDQTSVWGLGLHPWETQTSDQVELFLRLLPHCDAVGEIGLDNTFRAGRLVDDQRDTFVRVLKNEHTRRRMVSVHGQDSRAVIGVLEDYLCPGLIYHWFYASDRTVERAIALDIFYSVNHAVFSLPDGAAVISSLPRNRVLIETDAPAIDRASGRSLNPGDAETDDRPLWPGETELTEKELAQIWGVDPVQVRRQTWENLAALEARLDYRPFGSLQILEDARRDENAIVTRP